MSRLAELLEQKAVLEQQIADLQRAERAEAITQVKALIERHGLVWSDLAPALGPPKTAARGAAGGPATAPAAPAATGGAEPGSAPPPDRKRRPIAKVAPKYRDPATGETWSGRGLKPRWLVAALAAGRAIDEFRL
jgi:DNA-binding protein H-NS